MLKLERPLVVFDLETTDLDPLQARIIQFGAVRIEPTGLELSYETLVNPGVKLEPKIVEVTGITDTQLAGAPPLAEIFPQIWHILHGADLAGHNIRAFDVPILLAEAYRLGKPLPGPADRHYVDTWDLLNAVDPGLTYGHSLVKAYQHIFGSPYLGAHSALADSIAALNVLRAVLGESEEFHLITPAELEAWIWAKNAAVRASFHRYLREQAKSAPSASVDGPKATV